MSLHDALVAVNSPGRQDQNKDDREEADEDADGSGDGSPAVENVAAVLNLKKHTSKVSLLLPARSIPGRFRTK